jgi:catechol 2,3-dioxygenase-like lactoylglutathione lyase family enzyme
MHIQELLLHTRHLAEQQAFYRTTLGLPLLAETADSFTIQAGTTRLRFQETRHDVLYHIAFTIPRNTFAQAKSWLRERVSLLLTRNGEDEIFFKYSDESSGEPIDTRSLYFCDAANNILECIVHYNLSQETEGPFGADDVLYVSEIGLPVGDVLQLSATLKEQLAIEPYPVSCPISKDFAYLGDLSGQLVVVKIGRPWLPTETVLATVAPVQLTISGQREQQIQLSPYPYLITVTAS